MTASTQPDDLEIPTDAAAPLATATRDVAMPPEVAEQVASIEIVPAPAPTDLIVDAWFVETFHNIELPTYFHNRFLEAATRLKARLRAKE